MPPKKPAPVKQPAKAGPAKPVAGKAAPAAKKGAPPAGAKKGNVPANKGKRPATQAPPKPKEKVWTKEDDAARTIQTKIRQYLAKKELKKLRQKKEEYEELMIKLEKEV